MSLERNKATILASGLDPQLKNLRRLQAARSAQQKKLDLALENIEDYWEKVISAASKPKPKRKKKAA